MVGDFNAEIQLEGTKGEGKGLRGPYGIGQRNERGEKHRILSRKLSIANTLFRQQAVCLHGLPPMVTPGIKLTF